MIDMHSHIIPKVDDGSKSVEETFNMINEAKNAGFSDLVITSHFLLGYYEPKCKELLLWKNKLQEIIDSKNLGIKLHSGMEIYISNIMNELIEENKLQTIANSKYMLIELPINANINYLDYVLNYIKSKGIKPIIAHPERYVYLQDNPSLVEDYINKGALIQCNYGSILGHYGRKAKKVFKMLLKNNKVHFLGSDCHRQDTIYTKIPEAMKKIIKIIGQDNFNILSEENPRKVLNNEDL